MARRSLVTGVGGQDGVLLARELRARGHEVIGTVRPGRAKTLPVLTYLRGIEVVELDVRSKAGFSELLERAQVDEVYNLASMSSVGQSWAASELVTDTNAVAVLRMLEAIRAHADRHGRAPRFYQASSSEMFGLADQQPQTENTPHHPRSPYAVSKSFAHHMTVNFRESYGLFAVCGIHYNHESPLRGEQFVTRKITRAAAEIALGRKDRLTLGNLDIRRDWGSAVDHVRAMVQVMGADEPLDHIVATGVSRRLEDFLVRAFAAAGLDDPWRYVEQDPSLMRPAEVVALSGDATKIRETLGWAPRTTFEELVDQMVRVDLRRVETGIEESEDYLS